MQDYASSVLTFAAAARLALHRGDTKDGRARARRARCAPGPSAPTSLPSVSVRFRIHLASTYWVIGDHATARHLVREIDDILLHRPDLGALVDQVESLQDAGRGTTVAGAAGQTAAHAGRAAPAAVPADAPDHPRDRRAALRLEQHREHRGRLDLPQARASRLAARRSSGRPRWACSAAERELSRGRTRRRHRGRAQSWAPPRRRAAAPTTGVTPTSTSTISSVVAPALERGIRLLAERRFRAAHRDQRGEPRERQRLRVDRRGFGRRPELIADHPRVVGRESSQPLCVVGHRD